MPTNVKSVGLSVTAADMVPVFAATNVTAGAPSVTLTVAVPPGPARTFGVNAYDGLTATGTVLYQGQATVDVPPNTATAVTVPIVLGFLGGSTTAPTKPTGLLASSFSVGQVTLNWPPTETSQSVTGYVIYMAETAWTAPWTAALPLLGSMRHPVPSCCTFIHDGLSSTTTYYFALAAVNATGEAPESAQVSTIPNGGGAGGGATTQPPLGATVLASDLARPLHIAVDANNVYWSEWNGSPGAGRISTVAKSGGQVTPLVTGLDAPDDIALDTSFVYWGENRASGNVGKASKTPGPMPVFLASGRSFPFSVAPSDSLGSVFFLEKGFSSGILTSGILSSVSKTGGPHAVTGSDTLASQADDLILYESGGERVLYWPTLAPGSNNIQSFDFATGQVKNLAAANNPSHQIAADKDSVYWAETGPAQIKKVSRCCGDTPTVLAVADNPFAVAVDDLFVYWTELNAAPSGAVKRVATTGGPVTLLASGLNNSKLLAVDKDFVFLTEANTPNGAVRKFLNGRNTWTAKASMPTARQGLAAGVINNALYAVGGLGTASIALTSLESYNPLTNTWSAATSMPTARDGIAAGVINNILYVVGGFNSVALASLTSYDPRTNIWRDAALMSTARYGLTAGVIGGKLYAVGGTPDGSTPLITTEVYDPQTNTWTTLTSMPTPRYALAAGVAYNTLYAVGGFGAGSVTLSTIEAFSPP